MSRIAPLKIINFAIKRNKQKFIDSLETRSLNEVIKRELESPIGEEKSLAMQTL